MQLQIVCYFAFLAVLHITHSRSLNEGPGEILKYLQRALDGNLARLSAGERAELRALLDKSESSEEQEERREFSENTIDLSDPEENDNKDYEKRSTFEGSIPTSSPETELGEAESYIASSRTILQDTESEAEAPSSSVLQLRSHNRADENSEDNDGAHDFARRGPSNSYVKEVLDLTNAARGRGRYCGATWYSAVDPVQWDDRLALSSQRHAKSMLDYNYFSHTGYDGSSFVQRIVNAGYPNVCAASENIAGNQTPKATVDAWINSSGHCANLMASSVKSLGVGYAKGGRYGGYWVQNFGRC